MAIAALSLAPLLAGAADPQPGYRDLNHNGRLDPYEDKRQSIDARLADLIGQMTVEEKVGTLLHGTAAGIGSPIGASDKGYDLPVVEQMVSERRITSMISRLAVKPTVFAEQNNAIQKIAERSRLGIPITISTDPRNHFEMMDGVSVASTGFSQWPESLGFAAIGDPALVRRFGQVVGREYRAVGIHMALSPMADLATEPRWPRTNGTFGSDPAKVSALAAAYIEGLQVGNQGVRPDGVATIVKHWVGYGAEPDGFDAHNYYGRTVDLDNASFARHVAAFDGPLRVRSAGVMPTYAIIRGVTYKGKPLEPVGAGFNRVVVTDMLRGDKGFRGLVLSDWGITNDCPAGCSAPTTEAPQKPWEIAMPWGVEGLSKEDRFTKGLLAGIDQFGGVDDPAPLLAAIRAGKIPTARLDEAVGRVLWLKFALGLFDNPYVDVAATNRSVGTPEAQREADAAQRIAQVLLENRNGLLPLASSRKRVWLYGVNPDAARQAGLIVVDDPKAADVAIVRIVAPYERPHPNHFFGARHHEGQLDLKPDSADYAAIKKAAAAVPTIVAVDMDRPAILTGIKDKASGLIALFGARDAALLDVVTGKAVPKGRLPFELPRSTVAVAAQNPARSDDSAAPLYKVGYRLTLPARK